MSNRIASGPNVWIIGLPRPERNFIVFIDGENDTQDNRESKQSIFVRCYLALYAEIGLAN
ncbi:MAG: hypothetical protein LUO84_01565 [Methanomassiliicoccales archaeon]|nr:hypothetical protein [Methanomassiliicoccales archaeon]